MREALALGEPRIALLIADRGGRWASAAADSLASLAVDRPEAVLVATEEDDAQCRRWLDLAKGVGRS